MNALILSAGRAQRLGSLAPRGCKVLAKVKGRSVLSRQLELLGGLVDSVTVVCRSAHLDLLRPYPVETVAHDLFNGPVGAIDAAAPEGDTLIVYGDTLWGRLPEDTDDWIGVARAEGGRKWDVFTLDCPNVRGGGRIRYEWVPEDESVLACVGLYRLLHAERLTGPSMPDALQRYGYVRPREVTGWRDVGDVDAIAAYGELVPA